MSALEKGLIKLSWDMLVEYCNNSVDFNAYHILYQFLWRRIPSLPHIFDLHPNMVRHGMFRQSMDKMKRCNFVIWHYEISVPILNESQSAFDLYFTSARWMANNLQFCLNNDALYQDILTEFMLPLLMDHVPFLRMSASNENTWFLPKVMFPVLSHLVFEGRYDTIDSILSRIMACDELEGDNCFLFALGNRFQDNGMQWLDGLNLNQSQTFLNIMLKYVGDTFNGTERRIIARNLYAIKSDSIPMGQLQGVDRDHFLEELIQLFIAFTKELSIELTSFFPLTKYI
eukprot:383207_1